jgi:two-component system cell cycle sensor histidine kinase/response regulator CckA
VSSPESAFQLLRQLAQGAAVAVDRSGVPLRALVATSGLCAALVLVIRGLVPWLQARREQQVRVLMEVAQRARQARQQARESEDRVRLLLDSTVEAICGLDLGGMITFCNTAALRILGLSTPEQLLGRSFYAMARLPGADQPLPPVWIDAAVQSYARLEQELLLVRDDGALVPVQHSAAAMLRQGKIVGRVVTFLDVTERKRAEEALRKSQAQLRMADRLATVGTLSAGVAHEINNPLAYTLANLSYVRDALTRVKEPPPGVDLEELRASTAEAIEGAERVRRIVKDMKTLSRMDDERITAVDVEAALDASVNMVAHELRHRAQVVKDYGRVPLVRGNEGRLVQVFLNLLVNAAQAIAGNAPDRNEVRLATTMDGPSRVAIEISDTGVGIADEVLPRIFDPFFTTKPVGVGTGLGLSICHSLITAMGGSIEVASKVGVGTRFLILLPAADTASIAQTKVARA